MRFARGFVLLLALMAAGGAALLVQKATRAGVRPPQAARPEMVDILVAARAISVGDGIGKAELRWQPWPAASVPAGSIRRTSADSPAGVPIEAATARYAMLEGEPISQAKLLRPNDGSALAALLAPGMRALSVSIREETAAGGFIQPGDRVDVMVTRKQGETGREPARSDILLRGVKVLAIGKALAGKAPGAGRTATLEIAPPQASLLTAAQSGGDITLALIGSGDVGQEPVTASAADTTAEVRMLKFGRAANRQTQQ
jgi:pilus assembly protein CpaB